MNTLYFSNFHMCHHNEVISDNENLYYTIKHINIFILYVYLIFISASGIVSDMGKSMEYLFTSQATAAGF